MSASKPKKGRQQATPTDPWATMPNTERGRPMVTITLSIEGKAELDRQRHDMPRGAYIEQLLQDAKRSKKKA